MNSSFKANEWLRLCISMGIGLLVVGTVYSFGLSGSFHFDDNATLSPMSKITIGSEYTEYIFSGHTGPLGRPIALATFVLQHSEWPDNPSVFLLANIAIHLVNGLLASILCLELARATTPVDPKNIWKGAVPGILWILLPINAAAVLTVVQRMTLLAALFTIAGLIAFVHGRRIATIKPSAGLIWMTAGIVICTPLAAASKENGLLLPLYALTLHATLLANLPAPPGYRAWSAVFLKAPTLVIFGYLALQLPYVSEAYQFRNFDFYERITTQGYALLDYLRIIAFPRPLDISPFYDDYPVLGSHAPAFLGPAILFSWTLIVLWAISKRKRNILGAFAVLWFLAGHLLESTTLPLELFFLHRNYLPSLGIVIAVTFVFFSSRGTTDNRKFSIVLGVAILTSFTVSLLSTTTIWGAPRVAAELWVLERPSSIRAAEYLSAYYRKEGDKVIANKLLRDAYAANPNDAGIAIDRVHTYCDGLDSMTLQNVLSETITLLRSGYVSNQTTQKLDSIVGEMERARCPTLTHSDIFRLLEALEDNFRVKNSPLSRHNIFLIRFRLQISERLFSEAMSSLLNAYEAYPNFETLQLISETLTSGGLRNDAIEFIKNSNPPENSSYRQIQIWERKVSNLLKTLHAGN